MLCLPVDWHNYLFFFSIALSLFLFLLLCIKLRQKLRKLQRHYFICHLQQRETRSGQKLSQLLAAATWRSGQNTGLPFTIMATRPFRAAGWPNLWPSIEKFIKWQIDALCLPCPVGSHKCNCHAARFPFCFLHLSPIPLSPAVLSLSNPPLT